MKYFRDRKNTAEEHMINVNEYLTFALLDLVRAKNVAKNAIDRQILRDQKQSLIELIERVALQTNAMKQGGTK